jgi:hypothetical protein
MTNKPLLPPGTEIDVIRVSEAVWAREAAVGVSGLTPAERVFLCVWNLEAEVNNGGFEQFYINSAGDNAVETPAALRGIGAARAAAIAERANDVFGPPGDWAGWRPRRSVHWTPGSTNTLTISRSFCASSSSAIGSSCMRHLSWGRSK